MRKYLLVFMLLGLALALSACRAESNVTLSINEDSSASVGAEVGFDEEFGELISQTGQDPEDLFTEDFPVDIAGVEPYTRTDGDMTYYGFARDVEDLREFNVSEFAADLVGNFAEFSYEADESSAELKASLSAVDLGGDIGDLGFDPSDITGDIFSANIVVAMPGTVVEHNADEVRGDGSLVWSIPLTGAVSISATSEFGSSSSSWIFWVIGGVVLIGIAAGIAAVMSSRKDSENAVAAAAAAHATTSAAEPPPAPQTSDDASALGGATASTDPEESLEDTSGDDEAQDAETVTPAEVESDSDDQDLADEKANETGESDDDRES